MAEGEEGKKASEGGREYQNAMVLLQALKNHGNQGNNVVKAKIGELAEELGRLMV